MGVVPSRRSMVTLTVLGLVLLAGAAGLVRSSPDRDPDGGSGPRAGGTEHDTTGGTHGTGPAVDPPPASATTTTTRPRPPRTVTGDRAGFATTWTFGRPGYEAQTIADLDAMAASGARWVRVGAPWGRVEARPGHYDWSEPDRVVKAAVDRGLSVLGISGNPAGWAAAPGCRTHNCAPADVAAYARFLADAAAHFAPLGVRHWEVWNEPNTAEFWSPGADPAAYAELQRLAYRGIKAAVPTAVVVTGGLAPAGEGGGDMEPLHFMEEVYRHGAQGHFDAVAVHPYAFPYPPDRAADYNTFLKVPRLHDLMAAHGDGAKPIWGTEVGAPSRGPRGIGEDRQADWLTRYYRTWNAWSFTGPLLWYELHDFGAGRSDIEAFGLLRHDRSPKPAWRAWLSMIGAGDRLPAGTP